jgi:hypothetical protein
MTEHTTIGPQLPQPDPRGWLVFEWLPDDLQNAEDSTQAADHAWFAADYGEMPWIHKANVPWRRKATPAEITLLRHLHFDLDHLDGDLKTVVSYLTTGVRRRVWPQLETQDVLPGGGPHTNRKIRSISLKEKRNHDYY